MIECMIYLLWPFVCVASGLILGTLVAVVATLYIFVLTLIRTPCHILKTLQVAITTREIFHPCRYFDPLLRLMVFCLVPIPHLLWLTAILVIGLPYSWLFFIGQTTKTLFEHSYSESFKALWSNVKLEKGTFVGDYYGACQLFIEDDKESYDILRALKGFCSLIPGIPIGALPFIPFAIGVLFITIYRLPVNLYKTMKIAFFTVLLKWDLKILALVTMPLCHTIFPLAAFVFASVTSLFYFILTTSTNVYGSESPFEGWGAFRTGLQDYYKAHQEFTGKWCNDFDHPSGIPFGWRGDTYGIPIQQILKWQWDFVVCCFLLLFSFPICLAGSVVVFSVKLIPGMFSWWKHAWNEIRSLSVVELLGCWAFCLLLMLLVPIGAVLTATACIFAGTLLCFWAPTVYLEHGYLAGFYNPFNAIHVVDSWDVFLLQNFAVFPCLSGRNPFENAPITQQVSGYDPGCDRYEEGNSKATRDYWDRFTSQCVQTAFHLLKNNWITHDHIKSADPSVVQSIPAAAVLVILADSINEMPLGSKDVKWNIDGGIICKQKDHVQLDNIVRVLWPKVMHARSLLAQDRDTLACAENLSVLMALLCSDTDDCTEDLNTFLREHMVKHADHPHCARNGRIRTALVDLSLAILRVKPFQDRMKLIFEHSYTMENA